VPPNQAIRLDSGKTQRSPTHVEHLPQVRQESLIVTHCLARTVGQLRHRLIMAARQLHHNIERREVDVIGEVRADAKSQLRAIGEVPVQAKRSLDVE